MILDATTADRSLFEREFDVCVIGSGPAGITLARQIAAAGADVALMEAGGLEFSAESQDIYRGEIAGQDYFDLDWTRLRYFGGTSNHWNGMCRELDFYDFETKAYTPLSGWPIGKIDLDPYSGTAEEILDLMPATAYPDLPLEQRDHVFRKIQFRFSSATRFAEKYRDEITASKRIRLVLNANLVDLRLDEGHGRVTEAIFRSYQRDDPGLAVRARLFCLCAGGLENPRLLLNFSSQIPQGIGNQRDLVGRFWSEHPTFVLADVLLRPALIPSPPRLEFYAPTDAYMASQEVLNFGLRLDPDSLPPPLSLPKEALRSIPCATGLTERLVERVLGKSLKCEQFGLDEYFARRRPPEVQTGQLWISIEQALNRDSRVRLGEERDSLGLNRIVLDWRLSDLDFHTMRTAVTAFGMHMAEQDMGRLRIRDWLLADPPRLPDATWPEIGGNHHMCGTRMSDNPREGVVDRDCRVHGVGNLYVGGSSVFATTGHANPTYTIVQLALRLADHLVGRLAA